MNTPKPGGLPIRRMWGGTLNLFLAGDLFAAFFLPLWLAAGKEGITEGDAAQMILSCLLLFAVTLALRLAAWGLGRLLDRRVLGVLEKHRLRWGERTFDLDRVIGVGYRCFPFALLFRVPSSGVRLELDGETVLLEHAPYLFRFAIAARCPGARRRPTVGLWVMLAVAFVLCAGVTVWLNV